MTAIDTVRRLIERELESFKREINAFPDDASIWTTPPGVSNSAGTLALHIAGNLQHFIGARLGASGYVRDRDAEFARRGVSRAELLAELDRARERVHETLTNVSADSLPEAFPEPVGGRTLRSEDFLVQLAVHLAYHLGQADYHRRITTGDASTVETVAVSALPELDAVRER
jgi:hypothetical protein